MSTSREQINTRAREVVFAHLCVRNYNSRRPLYSTFEKGNST